MIEMIGDDVLAAAGDENKLLDTGLTGFFHRILDDRLVHHRQHFLGMALVAGKKRVPIPATGKTAFANGFDVGHVVFRAVALGFEDVFQGMVLKRPVSWHRPAIIVQFQSFLGNHGQVICYSFHVDAGGRFGACLTRHACDDFRILAALDAGEAQQAMTLSESALREEGISPAERARLLLYHGLARELLGQHSAAMRDLTLSLDNQCFAGGGARAALLQRGFLHDGLGELEEAVSDYSAAVALKDYLKKVSACLCLFTHLTDRGTANRKH